MRKEFFNGLKLRVLKEDYALVKSKKVYSDAFANIKDHKEITLVIEESKLKTEDIISIEKDFKILTFDTIIPFNLIGFIAKISQVLAKENISIFVLSSFSTEYVLVKKKDLEKSIKSLKKLGVKV